MGAGPPQRVSIHRVYPKTINHSILCIWFVAFEEIDDKLWAMVQPYFPPQKPKTGRPRCDLRKTFNGILYVHKTGTNWSDVPRIYGTKSTVHKLHMDLCRWGVYQKIDDILLSEGYSRGKIDLSCYNIDTKSVRAKKGRDRLRRF